MEQASIRLQFKISVVGILVNSGYKMITLSSGILPENETSKSVSVSITHMFEEGRHLLAKWHDIILQLYHGQEDLLQSIPAVDDLSLAKLVKDVVINTDGANAARRYCQNLVEEIRKEALAWGMMESESKTFEGDCWYHMCSVWFGVVINASSLDLSDALKDDLIKIHPML